MCLPLPLGTWKYWILSTPLVSVPSSPDPGDGHLVELTASKSHADFLCFNGHIIRALSQDGALSS